MVEPCRCPVLIRIVIGTEFHDIDPESFDHLEELNARSEDHETDSDTGYQLAMADGASEHRAYGGGDEDANTASAAALHSHLSASQVKWDSTQADLERNMTAAIADACSGVDGDGRARPVIPTVCSGLLPLSTAVLRPVSARQWLSEFDD